MKVGVYICHCGINIAATVDVQKVMEFAKTLPQVAVARTYQYMCSDPGQDLIKNDIKNLSLIAIGVYLVFGYILGSLNPFDAKTIVRLIQVVIFAYFSYLYFDSKK